MGANRKRNTKLENFRHKKCGLLAAVNGTWGQMGIRGSGAQLTTDMLGREDEQDGDDGDDGDGGGDNGGDGDDGSDGDSGGGNDIKLTILL